MEQWDWNESNMLIEFLSWYEMLTKLWTVLAGHKLYTIAVCFCVTISELQYKGYLKIT